MIRAAAFTIGQREAIVTDDRGRLVMTVLIAAAAALMIVFPARVLECDAVIYACAGLHHDVVQSTDAGHLVWGGLELATADWSRSLSPPLNPLYLLRWLSVASALLGAWLVYRFLAGRVRLPGVTAALFAAALLFSYSYWHFGLQGEPHAPHTLALTAFLLVAWPFLAQPSPRGAAFTGLALGAATLLHQTTILLVPAVVAAIVFACPTEDRRRYRPWLRPAAWFVGAYTVSVVIPYLGVGWFVRDLRTVADFRSWIMGISEWGGWGNWRPVSPVAALVGIVRSLTGSHYLLGIGPVREIAMQMFPQASWEDELLLAGAVPGWLRLVLVPIQLAVLAGTAWLLIRAAPRLRVAWRPAPAFALLLGLWLAVHTIFFTWWAPERAEFWIAFWLPLVVLTAPAAVAAGVRPRWLGLGVAGLAVVNLLGSIVPQSSASLEPATLAAVAIDPAVASGDVLLTDLPLSRRAGGFVYVLDIVAVPVDPHRAMAVADSLRAAVAARGGTIYWVSERAEPPPALDGRLTVGERVPVRADVVVRFLR